MNEWETEPNSVDWEYAGLKCQIRRSGSLLHLCGYVGVPSDHPKYGADYITLDVEVHGGLTYGRKGNSDDLWWFGFDCAPLYDLSPGLRMSHLNDGEYRDIGYVTDHTNQLAEQLAAMTPAPRGQEGSGG